MIESTKLRNILNSPKVRSYMEDDMDDAMEGKYSKPTNRMGRMAGTGMERRCGAGAKCGSICDDMRKRTKM